MQVSMGLLRNIVSGHRLQITCTHRQRQKRKQKIFARCDEAKDLPKSLVLKVPTRSVVQETVP